MAWYRNFYECPDCGAQWQDEWSCMCHDECGDCGSRDISPVRSTDLSVYLEQLGDGKFQVYISPYDADDHPAYVTCVTNTMFGFSGALVETPDQ